MLQCKRGAMGFTSPPWVNHSTFSEHFISLKCSSLALYLYATEEDILVLRMKWKVPLSVNIGRSRSPFHCSLSPLGARSAQRQDENLQTEKPPEAASPPACHHEDTISFHPYTGMNASLLKTLKRQGNRTEGEGERNRPSCLFT